MTDLPPEPGTVPDLDHGVPGFSEDLPVDDEHLGAIDADEDDGTYDDTDDEPDALDGATSDAPVDDGLDEPEDDSEG